MKAVAQLFRRAGAGEEHALGPVHKREENTEKARQRS